MFHQNLIISGAILWAFVAGGIAVYFFTRRKK